MNIWMIQTTQRAFKLVHETLNAKVCVGDRDFSKKVNCLSVEIRWELRLTF